MRFDKEIELYNVSIIDDEIGGREEKEIFIGKIYANINNLTFEETVKIYGEAMTGIVKATILGLVFEKVDRIKYKNKSYKVKNESCKKNKTCYLLELIEDEH